MDQGSSSGTGDEGSSKLQLKAYIEQQEGHTAHCIPVMVSITAPSGKLHSPVDLVVVLNVQDRPTKPQKLLVDAVKVVTEKLDGEADNRLAIVCDRSTVLSMTAGNSRVKMATNAVNVHYKKQGYTSTSMVRALATAEKILYGRTHEDKLRRAGHIIIISDSKDDPDSLLTWRFPWVHAFGFRDRRNARTMAVIATNPGCTYAILDDEYGRVTRALAAIIDMMTSSVSAVVKIKCEPDQMGELSGVQAPLINYFISNDKKVGTIFASAHLGVGGSAAATSFIVKLLDGRDDRGRNLGDVSKLFTLHMEYGGGHKINGEVVVFRKGMDHGPKQVAAEMVRTEALKMVTHVIEDIDDKDLSAAADELRRQWTATLENSHHGREAAQAGLIPWFASEMQEMEIRLNNNYMWLEYMLSWQSYRQWQLPLPPLFMEKQRATTADHLPQLEMFALVASISEIAVIQQGDQKDREPIEQGDREDPEPIQEGLPWPLALVRVVTPKSGLAKVKRLPVDLIAVLDTTCVSTESTKIKQLLVKATEVVMKKLNQKDRLAIIPIQSSSSVAEHVAPARLVKMSKQGQGETYTLLLSKLHIASAENNDKNKAAQIPHWRELLIKAMKLLRRSPHIETVSSSMPVPSQPKIQSTKLSTAFKDAMKILDDRQGEETNRPGFIVVISDSEDESICKETFVSTKYIIHAFSFRSSGLGNTRAMQHIARTSNYGIYGVLNVYQDQNDEIAEEFSACFDEITSIIGMKTTVDLKIMHNLFSEPPVLSSIELGRFLSRDHDHHHHDRQFGSIFVGDLCAGTVRSFVVYVENIVNTMNTYDYDSLFKLLEVHWLNAWTGVRGKVDGGRLVFVDQEELKKMLGVHCSHSKCNLSLTSKVSL